MNERDVVTIDLFDILKKIWKWKFLILTIAIIPTLLLFFYLKFKPDEFNVVTKISIGKIADYYIDIDYNIDVMINNKLKNTVECNKISSDLMNKKIMASELKYIELSYNTSNPDECLSCLKIIGNSIIKKHNRIYQNAIMLVNERIKTNKSVIVAPSYLLESYNYPSKYILEPQVVKQSINIKNIVLFFIAFSMLGIMISFFIDYSQTIKKDNHVI